MLHWKSLSAEDCLNRYRVSIGRIRQILNAQSEPATILWRRRPKLERVDNKDHEPIHYSIYCRLATIPGLLEGQWGYVELNEDKTAGELLLEAKDIQQEYNRLTSSPGVTEPGHLLQQFKIEAFEKENAKLHERIAAFETENLCLNSDGRT